MKFVCTWQSWALLLARPITVVNEISGNLILQVKEARIALDKTMAMRIMVA